MVYYRKYRPQTINDLDNKAVREALYSVLSKNPPSFQDVPHAFLFTGPKGLGKTSAARIVAKVVNCETRRSKFEAREAKLEGQSLKKTINDQASSFQHQASSIEPCNQCDQCITITNGSNLDILEIDAASNRGIDEIRDLKDKIRLAPFKANKKVYIIDEVHMLTTEAFNALLKTLEEPPDHALFILCTTEIHKVPETIISRCFHLSFHQATQDELIRSFRRIIAGEGLEIDAEALIAVAELADGGFRDGAKILEELSNIVERPSPELAEGKKITKDVVEQKFHFKGIAKLVDGLLIAFSKKDVKGGLKHIGELMDGGTDMKYFIEQLTERLHQMLLAKIGVQSEVGGIKLQLFTLEELPLLFKLLSKAHADLRVSILPQLPLELAIIEWSNNYSTLKPSPLGRGQVTDSPRGGEGRLSDTVVSVSSLRKQVGSIHKQKALAGDTEKDTKVEKPAGDVPVSLLHFNADGEHTKEWINELWKNIILRMKDYNHTLAGVLRGCRLKSFDRSTLVIETAYKFHKERLDEPKTKATLDTICTELTGNKVQVAIELKSK